MKTNLLKTSLLLSLLVMALGGLGQAQTTLGPYSGGTGCNTGPNGTGSVIYSDGAKLCPALAGSTLSAAGGFLNETQATLSAPAAPTLTVSATGGTITQVSGTTVYVRITFVNAFGETVGSTETSIAVSTGNGCTAAATTCSVTVTAPTLTGNATGYTVYDSIIQGQEIKQTALAACSNISANCVIGTPGTGTIPPFFSTASNGILVVPVWASASGTGAPIAQNYASINPGLMGNVFYVNPACLELGACIGQLLAGMPSTGGRIHVPALATGACWPQSVPVASNVSGKVIVIEGDPNATCINYTGPSGTTPFQLSWGTLHNIGGGIRDLELDNGLTCAANTNTGIDMGGGGGGMGAEMGFLQNVKVFCFNNGISVPSTGNTFLMTMSHLSVSGNGGVGCTNGISIQNGENLRVDNSAVYQCVNGVNSASNVDWEMLDSSIDDNAGWGVLHTGSGVVNMHNTHFENVGQGPAQYVKTTNGHVALYGGQMLEDRPVASISTTTCSANVLTVVTTTANHRSAGEEITLTGIAGTGTGGNGDWTVTSITNSTTFTSNHTCTGTFTASTGTVKQTAFVEMGGSNLAMTTVTVGTISNGQVDRVVNFTAGQGQLSIINAQPTLIANEFNLAYNGSRVISCPLRADAAVATCRYFGYNIDAPQGTINASILQLGGGSSLSTSGNWTMQKNGNTVNGVASSAFYGGRFGLSDDIAEDTSGNWGFRADVRAGGSLISGTAPTVTTPGTGGYDFGTEGTEPASIASGTSGFVADSTSHCMVGWFNAVNQGCVLTTNASQIQSGENSIVADSAGINSTETVIVKSVAAMPANRLTAGTVIRAVLEGTCTSTAANISTFAIRIGTAGTTSDAIVLSAPTSVAATTGTAVPFRALLTLTVRTTGASATASGFMTLINQGTTGIVATATNVVLPTMTTFSTTAANFIDVTYKSAASTTTSTFKDAYIDVVVK